MESESRFDITVSVALYGFSEVHKAVTLKLSEIPTTAANKGDFRRTAGQPPYQWSIWTKRLFEGSFNQNAFTFGEDDADVIAKWIEPRIPPLAALDADTRRLAITVNQRGARMAGISFLARTLSVMGRAGLECDIDTLGVSVPEELWESYDAWSDLSRQPAKGKV